MLGNKKKTTDDSAALPYPAPMPGSNIPDQTPPPVGSRIPDQRPKWLREAEDGDQKNKKGGSLFRRR
ncbi:hypothetical protein ACFC09_36200 [Streptomyces sp. NPDC056161]|uniref:hypothetical protein n=1 Tax=Streptomyces sp. NPDC056161 TaxID=3345732 RepID=UPI0035D64178